MVDLTCKQEQQDFFCSQQQTRGNGQLSTKKPPYQSGDLNLRQRSERRLIYGPYS